MLDCSLQTPIHHKMNCLSMRSPELYIFWQNYNHLYELCSERQTQIDMLKVQVQRLRSEKATSRLSGPSQMEMAKLKDRAFTLQKQNSDLKADLMRAQNQLQGLTTQNTTLVQQNKTYLQMTRQFKKQNEFQRSHIQQILQRLKQAETDLRGSRINCQALEEANSLIEKSLATENRCRVALLEKDTQMRLMAVSMEEMRITFERVLAEAMRSVRNRVVGELQAVFERCRTVRHSREVLGYGEEQEGIRETAAAGGFKGQ